MTVVASAVYRDGQRDREFAIAADDPSTFSEGEFVWIGLVDPTQQELRALQGQFGLHPLAVEDAFRAHQLPKVDVYGDQLFVVVRTAQLEGDQITYGETAIFIGPSHIITARHGSARAHTGLRTRLEAAPGLLRLGVDYVLHAVLDFVVDGYVPIVSAIEDEMLVMEAKALDTFLGREEIARIFNLRREVLRFRRILGPTGELSSKLAHLDMPCLDAGSKPYFSNVLDHVRRAELMIEGVLDVLTSVLEVSSLLEQQRQGAITRKLAAWAAILAVPTAIAGIYGMNFENMPGLRWRYGFIITIGMIGIACTALYRSFRKARWL